MKIAIVFLLALSCLCELEAQQQAQPLVPESKKTDIIIPTSNPRPITVKLGNQPGPIQVDGHRIVTGPAHRRIRRRLVNIRHRLPVVHRKMDDETEFGASDEAVVSDATQKDETHDGEEGEKEVYEEAGHHEEGDFDNGQTEKYEEGDFDNGQTEEYEEESPESDATGYEDEEYYGDENGYEEHYEDENEGHYEDDDENQNYEEFEEVNGECEYTNYDDYEAALTCAFESFDGDIEIVLQNANSCLGGLNDAGVNEHSSDVATDKVIPIEVVSACSAAFKSLQTIQDLMRQCSGTEYGDVVYEDEDHYGDGNDEEVEYVDGDEEYVDDYVYPEEEEYIEHDENGEHGKNGEYEEHGENGGDYVEEDASPEEHHIASEEAGNESEGHESEGHETENAAESSGDHETEEERKRARVMRIRRINRLRHLNALRHRRMIKAGKFRRVRRLVSGHPRRRVVLRRVLHKTPIRRRVMRHIPGHNVIVRPHLRGKRIIRRVIRRAAQRVVKPASVNNRPIVHKFHRYA
jgi:hypothetical protein